MLNQFPTKNRISKKFSPKTILSGESLDYKKHLQIQFGQYFQIHENHTPRISEKERTLDEIPLGPSGNKQGGYYFMSLKNGSKVHRFSWDEVSMPDSVIKQVNTLGKDYFIFTDRKGRLIGENILTGVDGETENPLQIEIIEDDDLNQPDAVDDELAAQPTKVYQHQEADLGNKPEVELVKEPRVEPQEPNLVEPESQVVPKDDTPELTPGVHRSQRVRT